jgi:hypothetical protein
MQPDAELGSRPGQRGPAQPVKGRAEEHRRHFVVLPIVPYSLVASTLLTLVALLATADAQAQTADELEQRADAKFQLFELADAADALEAMAQRFPKDERSVAALRRAVAMRLALGQRDAAASDAALFVKFYGRKRRHERDRVLRAVADARHAAGEHREALTLVRTMRPRDAIGKLLARQIEAHALLALGKESEANRIFAEVRATHPDAAALGRLVDAHIVKNDSLQNRRQAGRALSLVAEATYRAALEKRDKVGIDRVPKLHGRYDQRALDRFLATKVPPWLKATVHTIGDAERSYLEVVKIRPAPPPKWVIASAADVFSMWADMVGAVEGLPKPHLPDDLLAIYTSHLEAMTAPLLQRAKQAAQHCVDEGAKYQIQDGNTQRCESWLVAHFPRQFVAPTMLAPRPHHLSVPNPPRALADGESSSPG